MLSKGNLIVISAPSGSGKTSLASRVVKEVPRLKFSVSHTTRKSRRGERHGVDYFFVSEQQFKGMVQRNAFLEYASVYGHYYGTSQTCVHSELEAGNDVLLDIDIQGALKVKERVPEALMVFLLPPSLQVLRTRLESRGLDDENSVEERLRIAQDEVNYYSNYEYVIINEDIEKSSLQLERIVLAARCRLTKQKGQAEEILRTFREQEEAKK